MAKQPADPAESLAAARTDILRTFPEAAVKWETKASPYMVSVSIDGALVRAFIEPAALAERGRLYDAFIRRIAELLTDASKPSERHDDGSKLDLARSGIRPTLSAAKTRH
jgi:hypothetical protein